MKRPSIETKTVQVPSGYTITFKKLTYGENKSVYSEALGDNDVSENIKVTLSQAQNLITATLAKSIIEWDIEEEDGSKTPITKENIESILEENDINFLMEKIKDIDSKKK